MLFFSCFLLLEEPLEVVNGSTISLWLFLLPLLQHFNNPLRSRILNSFVSIIAHIVEDAGLGS